jgi:hypothetical protein
LARKEKLEMSEQKSSAAATAKSSLTKTNLVDETKEIRIITSPAFDSQGRRRHEHVEVRLAAGGEVLLVSRQPLLDAARYFLTQGADPATVLTKVHGDKPDVVTMKSTIGLAAQYDVLGSRFVRRKPPGAVMTGAPKARSPISWPESPDQGCAHQRAPHNADTVGPSRSGQEASGAPDPIEPDQSAPSR